MKIAKNFLQGNSEKFTYKNGHWNIELKAMNSLNSEETEIDFVLDTGANITIINPSYFETLKIAESGIEITPSKTKSYGSDVPGKVWILPFLFIGGFTVKDVYCFTPNDPRRTHNLLGIKVLAKFYTMIDPVKSRIYFEKHDGILADYKMLSGEVFVTPK
ncbi:MAG: aspartyl protease family protein [Defluviitaleaceae bacterium]|nr:aspartyl protease family protein [Defluviitaleaceae bacterium]